MEIFNVSPWELVLILLVALIVLGPENMVKTARSAGKAVNRFTKSAMWATLRSTTKELRDLPTRIVREAGLEEPASELDRQSRQIGSAVKQLVTEDDEVMDDDLKTRTIYPGTVPYTQQNKPKAKPPVVDEPPDETAGPS
jgi:Sec-independent protein translocase protein TatA